MKLGDLASRYAKALYELSQENNTSEAALKGLRNFQELLSKDKQAQDYFLSPHISVDDKEVAIDKVAQSIAAEKTLTQFLKLLNRKDRLAALSAIVSSFQSLIDDTNGVVRGTVSSAEALSPEERKEVEAMILARTKKKAVLNYKEDPSLIGGVVAEVGTYIFDDTIKMHLRKMKEDLTRRAN